MGLEALKAAMDQALAAAEADPKNAELVAKAQEAKAAYEEALEAAGQGNGDEGDPDESSLDEKTKAYLAKLRKENASHRLKNKELASLKKASDERVKAILEAAGIEIESEDPETKVKSLTQTSQQLAFRNAILESAVQNGISGEDVEYYEFLITKATSELEEDEELSEEALAEIVAKVKKAGGKSGSTTSVAGGGKTPPKPGSSGQISLDQFVRMSITEKSKLYTDKPDLYNALMAEAKAKKRLV